MNNIYGIKDAANVLILKKSDGKPFIYADYATEVSNQWSQDSVYAMSKSVRAIRWDHNKQSTLKLTLEIFDLRWLTLLTGSEFIEGVTQWRVREPLTVATGNKVVLPDTPKVGSLIVKVLNPDDGLTELDELVVGDPATTADAYSISGNTITLNATTCPVGSQVVVHYLKDTAATAQTMAIDADTFSFPVEIFLDSMIRDTDGLDKFSQVHYLNAKGKGNFTLTFSASNITKLEIEFDILKDSKSSNMATYTIV